MTKTVTGTNYYNACLLLIKHAKWNQSLSSEIIMRYHRNECRFQTSTPLHNCSHILSKCAGVEIHSFNRSYIRDHFVLEWKSTLKLVESTLKRVIQTTLEWIHLF